MRNGQVHKSKQVLKALVVAGLFVIPSVSYADDAAATAAPAESAPAGPAPLDLGEDALAAVGLKPTFDDYHLKVYGWVEASYTAAMDPSKDNLNTGRVFDYRSPGFLFNQSSFNLERTLADGKDFDIGGKVELMYGTDMRFIHSNGLLDDYSGTGENPQNGNPYRNEEPAFDPTQFYLTLRAPIGNGLTIKAGKFVTPLGVEVIDAPGNALYSHSFAFNYAIPLTHTGVELDYPINDKLTVNLDVVEGWDVFSDNNHEMTYIGGATYKFNDKISNVLNVITGPERSAVLNYAASHDWRTVVDEVFTWQITDPLSFTFGGDFGNESGAAAVFNGPPPTNARDNNWYGVTTYLSYTVIPSQLNANLRAEYFVDDTGTRVPGVGAPVDLFEVTGGLDIHPLKDFLNLRIRPEVRYDRASHPIFDTNQFGVGQNHDQITLAADLIITF